MNNLVDVLKIRYTAVIQSGSDPLFYQNVHAYIDFIVKTPKLLAVIDKSEDDYSREHSDLWRPYTNDERELDRREGETYRIELFSLYASHFCTLLVRIYWPIEYYKNPTDELDDRIDPVVMLMLKGFDRTVRMRMWSKDDLKSHNKWFDGQRKHYEEDLRQFHADFLTEVYKGLPEPVETHSEIKKTKIPLRLNLRTGDFSFYKTTGSFSPVSQEFKVLKTLYEDKDYQASYLALLQSYIPQLDRASKSHKDMLYQIVRNIKEKLAILPQCESSNPDIFKTAKGLGYRLSLSPDVVGAE